MLADMSLTITFFARYGICEVMAGKGDAFSISVPNVGCVQIRVDGEPVSNPQVFFDADTPPTWPPLNLDQYGQVVQISEHDLYLAADLDDPNCRLIPAPRYKSVPVVIASFGGQQWMFESQVQLDENSLETPLANGGGDLVIQTRLTDAERASDPRYSGYEVSCWDAFDTLPVCERLFNLLIGGLSVNLQVACSNARMSFVNMESCVLSHEPNTCTPRDTSDVEITLDAEVLRKIYDESGGGAEGTRYLYAVQGLRQEGSLVPYRPPCASGETSRWIRSECSSDAVGIQPDTNNAFRTLIAQSTDDNPYVRDVTFPLSGSSCSIEDAHRYGFMVNVNGECWLNVHRSHLQVFDFTAWVSEHPGGQAPIIAHSASAEFLLDFPDWHGMDRWDRAQDFLIEIGRLGDEIKFSELPLALTTEAIAVALDAYEAFQVTGPAVVCGTPNEVSNRPSTAGELFHGALGVFGTGQNSGLAEQKKKVWLDIALNGEDQLRQRVAWVLSQILVVSPNPKDDMITEPWLSYYDIFVRHAFGNYRTILKEVSFSPM